LKKARAERKRLPKRQPITSNIYQFLIEGVEGIRVSELLPLKLIFLMKEPDSYIFTPDYNHNQMLRRESIIKFVNKVMRQISKQLPNEPNMTSHSFRSGLLSCGKIRVTLNLLGKRSVISR